MVAELMELQRALETVNQQVQQLNAALAGEKMKTDDLKKKLEHKDQPSIVDAIRKRQMKDIAPKKYNNPQSSGSFKTWAKEMKDFIFWHDGRTKGLIEYFEEKWAMDSKLSYADMKQCVIDKSVDVEVDSALHRVLGASLEGEAKLLCETAELHDPDTLGMHKSGLELWRHLK